MDTLYNAFYIGVNSLVQAWRGGGAEVMEIEVSELVFLGLLFIGWQLGRVATAIKSVAVELTTARWERSHRKALKRDSEDQREAALPLGR